MKKEILYPPLQVSFLLTRGVVFILKFHVEWKSSTDDLFASGRFPSDAQQIFFLHI